MKIKLIKRLLALFFMACFAYVIFVCINIARTDFCKGGNAQVIGNNSVAIGGAAGAANASIAKQETTRGGTSNLLLYSSSLPETVLSFNPATNAITARLYNGMVLTLVLPKHSQVDYYPRVCGGNSENTTCTPGNIVLKVKPD